ncbi:MAG: ATP-binding cassette domain-containing protein [Gaiellaceae bacterium MAG52_C11]|nr:ATP-binding cassette domain-containing protein [Candidatus Gaiellasilicea maunaloa]
MALASLHGLEFSYPGSARTLGPLSLELEASEIVALLGPSGSGKSTLLRALSGLVPHFHGGRFAGRAVVAGLDTRTARPAELAGTVATVFQDPEDQVVMTVVANEVAFGLENLGTPPAEIWPRVERALVSVDALHLRERKTVELSGGELQRVCLASALALEPQLLLLDEPTSQLDPDAAALFLAAVERLGATVVLSEQRVGRALELATRVLFVEDGRLLLDAPTEQARGWLAANRPSWTSPSVVPTQSSTRPSETVLGLRGVTFGYRGGPSVLDGIDLSVGRGEIVALSGANGSGKTTLAKLAAGLFEPDAGSVRRVGRAGYLSQDPGRYVVCETALAEVALAVDGDESRAQAVLERFGLGWAAARHPRDLSSGERERLGIAAVAVAEPDLLVLDEPTRGLDPDRKGALGRWLEEYAAAGRGVLVATHDLDLPAHRRIGLSVETTQAPLAGELVAV